MDKLYFCTDCKRILKDSDQCEYCNSSSIKELNVGVPVNVIGTKLKGKVLKIKSGNVKLLIKDENKDTYIKEYEAEKLRKVI
ncbi:hypothetical protein [Clostridium sp. JN-9]|uniref:hypothetical protein n=1 Tax=Clostridium sp. JN-9 TaxID=2507159 RepID=UPI000FFE0C77|nr:hypothetical protein [Clostridium sp. JN-9]QAT40705.1 hypothetical protein EQM05_10760 [Clostridium sp. JN-9]